MDTLCICKYVYIYTFEINQQHVFHVYELEVLEGLPVYWVVIPATICINLYYYNVRMKE